MDLTNHRVYQELVHRNEVLKTILTGSATPSPPRGFRATFLDLIDSLSWSLERATTGFKIAIASLALVNPEPYECQIKCVHRGR